MLGALPQNSVNWDLMIESPTRRVSNASGAMLPKTWNLLVVVMVRGFLAAVGLAPFLTRVKSFCDEAVSIEGSQGEGEGG